jgi:hypothetical protein
MSGSVADISAGGGGIDLTKLISVISPILLGSGKTTGGTSSASSSDQNQTQVSTTQKNADPGTLAALLGIASNASANAQNPDITNQIVQNIFRQSAEAFAPTLGTAASTGLYNTSTLGLLSNDARARATAQAASSVLNFQTSQQQIASGALTNVLNATGSSTTTTALNNKTAATNQGSTFNITAPSLGGSGILTSVAGIAASVLGKKALDAASPFLQAHLVDPIKNALGLGDASYSDIMSNASKVDPGFYQDATAPLSSADTTVNTASSSLDISNSLGADFGGNIGSKGAIGDTGLTGADLASANGIAPGTEASNITIAGASDLVGSGTAAAGTAESLAAPTVDIAAAAAPETGNAIAGAISPSVTADTSSAVAGATPGIGDALSAAPDAGIAGLEGAATTGTSLADTIQQAGSGLVDFASNAIDSAGNFVSDTLANSGDLIAGGIGSLGLGEAFKGIFGQETGGDLSLAASGVSAISGELGGPTIGSVTSDLAGAASGALGLTTAASAAGLTSAGGFATLAGLEGAADAVGAGAGILGGVGAADLGVGIGAGAAEAAGAAAGGISFGDVALAVAALAGWVVCTELTRQGKIPTKIYRYALRRFNLYNHWGVRGYHKWGIPLKNYVRDNPDTKITAVIAYLFLKRAHNLALLEGCPDAKWTRVGAVTTFACYWISAAVGVYLGFKCAWDQKRILKHHEIFGKFSDIHLLTNINNGGI